MEVLQPFAVGDQEAFELLFRHHQGEIYRGETLIMVPLLMIIYYLVWKYLVGFLNDMLGIG